MTYDALGNIVEVASGGAYTVFEYTPIGSKIVWNESNLWTHGHLPMPGGTSLDWTPSATYIHHKDWLGSSRITTVAGAVYSDKAFGAYGEDTAQDFGGSGEFNFTGDWQDIETAVYDTPNREYMPYQSRWPNVDPARSGWNAFAYVTNPNSIVDPSGLDGQPGCQPGTNCQAGGIGSCSATNSCFPPSPCTALDPCGPGTTNATYTDFGGPTSSGGGPQGMGVYVLAASFPFLGPLPDNDPDQQVLGGLIDFYEWQELNEPSSLIATPTNGSLLSALENSPWVVSWIVPLWPLPPAAGVGPAGSIAWNPATKTLCESIGAGASVGDNLAVGPVIGRTLSGQQASPSEVNQVFGGWSVNGGVNVPIGPVPVGPGVQGSANGSGAVYGPTVGVAGASVSSTYAVCASF